MSFFSTDLSNEVPYERKIRIHGQSTWRLIMEQAYPLPQAPPEMCRDEFLAQLLKPYESSTSTVTLESGDSILSKRVKYRSTVDTVGSYNLEAKMLNRMLWDDKRFSGSKRESTMTDLALHAPDLNKLMKERYGNIASAIGFMAVIFQLQQLKDRMFIFRELWKMSAPVDKELRLFGWSIKDYMARFTRPNLVYLDTAERLLGNQMECFKFRMDLKEFTRLIDGVIEDVRNKRDICKGSMVTIKDAEVDIEVLLTKSQKEAAAEHSRAAKAAANTPRSADPFGSRAKEIYTKINYNDFVFPIEARYRINWAQASMEQSIHNIEFNEKRLINELNFVNSQTAETGALWNISNIAYNMQILNLKRSITQKETEYELAMEEVENQIQVTRTRLDKAQNDLKHYRVQIPMFHAKIAEIQLLKARQEEEKAKNALLLQRASRKASRHSSKIKAEMQKK